MDAGKLIKTLKDIPINVPFIEAMMAALTNHGATIEETLDRTFPGHNGGRHGYREYTITFPEGTRCRDHDVVRHTTPFTIYFPDGFEMPGRSIYPGHRSPDDSGTIILYLPCELINR